MLPLAVTIALVSQTCPIVGHKEVVGQQLYVYDTRENEVVLKADNVVSYTDILDTLTIDAKTEDFAHITYSVQLLPTYTYKMKNKVNYHLTTIGFIATIILAHILSLPIVYLMEYIIESLKLTHLMEVQYGLYFFE